MGYILKNGGWINNDFPYMHCAVGQYGLNCIFFEIPYQLVEMGGTQEAVSILNVIHAVVYVVSSGISSRKITKDRHNKNLMLFLIICLSSVYAATCFAVSPGWICGFVAVHGLLIGVFWSAFWSAFYRVQAQAPIKISTLTILSALCSVIGPFVAGKLYIVFGKYVLLLFRDYSS